MKTREYAIYSTGPRWDGNSRFSAYSIMYSRGTHRWVYYVRATSLREAWSLCRTGETWMGRGTKGIVRQHTPDDF